MISLGISGHRRYAAAALSVDGVLRAAVMTAHGSRSSSDRHEGLPLHKAIADCLAVADVRGSDVAHIVRSDLDRPAPAEESADTTRAIDDGGAEAAMELLARLVPVEVASRNARAASAAAAIDGDALVFVLESCGCRGGALFEKRDGRLRSLASLPGADGLAAAIAQVAGALGIGRQHMDGLARLAAASPHANGDGWGRLIAWDGAGNIAVSEEGIASAIEAAQARSPGPLHQAGHLHVGVQEQRREVASACVDRVTRVVCAVAEHFLRERGLDRVAAAGTFFDSPGLNTRIHAQLGDRVVFAPFPEPAGVAAGAALCNVDVRGMLQNVRLGPAFTEQQIKTTIENCRLDYVYEPHWPRLLARVSALLAKGNLVAWMQGPVDFGERSFGSRSILCDPSNRYARENANVYLMQRALDHPLAVSIPAAAADECFASPVRSPFMLLRATVKESWRDRFSGALDHDRACLVHTTSHADAPELANLLDVHRQRTGVPALVNMNLVDGEGSLVSGPRDAIRTAFASAVDALVIGRFLMMKDYWLLRSETV